MSATPFEEIETLRRELATMRWREEAIANANKIAAERDAAKQSIAELEKERDEQIKDASLIASANLELREELDALQRENTAMRDALEVADKSLCVCLKTFSEKCEGQHNWPHHEINNAIAEVATAISPTAGRNYVRREPVDELIKALLDRLTRPPEGVFDSLNQNHRVESALAAAQKELA